MHLELACSEDEDLCPAPADPEPPFELGARLAPDTVNSGRDWVDKHTYADANMVSRTLCFTGAGNYARQQAYCDLECKANAKTRKAVAKASGRDDDGYNEDCRGPWYSVWKSNLRRVRPESPRRPPRHRRNTCSMAWRCRFLTARRSQRGHVVAQK